MQGLHRGKRSSLWSRESGMARGHRHGEGKNAATGTCRYREQPPIDTWLQNHEARDKHGEEGRAAGDGWWQRADALRMLP